MCDTPDYPVTEKSAEKVVSDLQHAMTQHGRNVARRSAVSPSVSLFISTSLTIFQVSYNTFAQEISILDLNALFRVLISRAVCKSDLLLILHNQYSC